MSRVVIEFAFIFLLPTLAYIAYVAFVRRQWPGLAAVIRNAPLLKLFALGLATMLAGLFLFSSRTGHDPRESYTPPSYSGGSLNPGNAGTSRTKQ